MNRRGISYEDDPPWEMGRPHAEFVRLAEQGDICGSVLDVGCGTGENALYMASLGHEVWGIDLAPHAVEKAQAKALSRGLSAKFFIANALELSDLGRTFDSVIDCGLFHTFSDAERLMFAMGLSKVLRRGGTYFVLCMSEHESTGWGRPRRVTQSEIRATFGKGWRVNYIREARFGASLRGHGPSAWLSSITRT